MPAAERPTTLFGAAAPRRSPTGTRASPPRCRRAAVAAAVVYSGVGASAVGRVSSVTALRKLEGEAAAVTTDAAAEPGGGVRCRALRGVPRSLLRDACELQHNALTPAAVHLVPASALHFRGAPLASRPTSPTSGATPSPFRAPAFVPVLGALDGASAASTARSSTAAADAAPAVLERLDAASFFGAARKALPCSASSASASTLC